MKAGDTLAPAGTVIEGGGTTPGSLLERVTMAPPDGAGPFRCTVLAVVGKPPTTVPGDAVTEDSTTGLTVKLADLLAPLYVAVTAILL